MIFACIIGAKFTMSAETLTQGGYTPATDTTQGHWDRTQDPDTGAIIRTWVPADVDPVTPGVQVGSFPCVVRGISGTTARGFGTIDTLGSDGEIDTMDYAIMEFPVSVQLSKRDKVTNIKGSDGTVIWREEEFDGSPTVFKVMGVVPITDPFGVHIENKALLARAQVQQNAG